MKMNGSATAYFLVVLLLIVGGYLINKGIISVNLDKIDLLTTTTLKPVSSSTTSSTTKRKITTTTKEDVCRKKGTNFEMSIEEAKDIALHSECGEKGNLKNSYHCNEGTGTWWIDLDIQKEGCNPACVVNVETKQAEINWRCTGLLQP